MKWSRRSAFARLCRRVAYTRPGVLRFSWRALKAWIWKRILEWRLVDGVLIATYPLVPERESEAALAHVMDALRAWQEIDPAGFLRARKVLRRVVIISSPRSHYHVAADACVISLADALHATRWDLAGILVHEAVHARFLSFGIPYDAERGPREERACIAHELRFLETLPRDVRPQVESRMDDLRTYLRHGITRELTARWSAYEKRRARLEQLDPNDDVV